jgi:hypothetical protein
MEELVRKLLPKFFHNLGRNFAATEGSVWSGLFMHSNLQ